MIIGFVGLIGSGKDTAAQILVNEFNFQRESFAGPLKDVLSAVFGWNRLLLEGTDPYARHWREQPDEWWSARLNMEVTPRNMMQMWGTDVVRNHFNTDTWIASLENRLQKSTNNIVISDARFPNEIESIQKAGGYIIRVKRGPDPEWWDNAVLTASTTKESEYIIYDNG